MLEILLNDCGSTPLLLSSRQNQVVEALKSIKCKEYSLADWYIGAIYAAKNINNPDRFSQAAQSLRELLEKLPRIFIESDIHESKYDFKEMREKIRVRLSSDKERYNGIWNGKKIDGKLNKTIQDIDNYFTLNNMPTRREQINSALNNLDPMSGAFDQTIRLEKYERFKSIWGYFEALAHHKNSLDEKGFFEQFDLTDRLIIELLAPITAQDQCAIRDILSKTQPEQIDVKKLLDLIIRRGANYAYFFKTVDNPFWITPLRENHFFEKLPAMESTGDGHINFPLWWPILFLQRVAAQAPEQVVEVILGFEQTDNLRILREIFAIACDLQNTALSLRLKKLLLKFLHSSYQWDKPNLIIKILKKWGQVQGSPRDAAYKIIKHVIAFQPAPEAVDKQSRRREDPEAIDTSLEPAPRFGQWEYQQILEKGVRSVADYAPYQVACILIKAVEKLIELKVHRKDLEERDDQDYSEFWCRRLNIPRGHQNVDESLVQTLTYACEKVYETTPEYVEQLDRALRASPWRVFKRLRQHLYAEYPSDQTLLWIREEILTHDGYSNDEHQYEFQVMIRKSCEYFGARLLNADEQKIIFDAIRSGPLKEGICECNDELYGDEKFQKYRRYFHKIQLRPFVALLDDETRRYFNKLEDESTAKAITDNDYAPFEITAGFITEQSPKSAEEMESLTDEEPYG